MTKRLLLALLMGCGHTETQPASTASPPQTVSAPPIASAKPVFTPSAVKEGPKVVLTITGPGQLEIDANGVSLASELAMDVKRRSESAWKPLEASEPYQLVEACSGHAAPGACTSPDHPFHPVAWKGMTCGSQCVSACRATVPVGPGTFRFVVSTCDHQHRYQSPEFEFGGAEDMAANDRHWAAKSTTRGTIARLELPPKWDGTSAPTATTIAGMTIKGKEQPLDDDSRRALVDALDSTTGYDDVIAKRCSMGKLVGFKLTRTLPTTGDQPREQTNEIAIDFNCQDIFITRGASAPRVVHGSHYDPSRPAFVALAQKYFTDIK